MASREMRLQLCASLSGLSESAVWALHRVLHGVTPLVCNAPSAPRIHEAPCDFRWFHMKSNETQLVHITRTRLFWWMHFCIGLLHRTFALDFCDGNDSKPLNLVIQNESQRGLKTRLVYGFSSRLKNRLKSRRFWRALRTFQNVLRVDLKTQI